MNLPLRHVSGRFFVYFYLSAEMFFAGYFIDGDF